MTTIVRRWLDEMLAGAFFLLLAVLSFSRNAPFLEPIKNSGLSKKTLAGAIVVAGALLLVRVVYRKAPTFSRAFLEFSPFILALLAYESLKHMHATALTLWLGIQPKDAFILTIDNALFGKTPYLWFADWGLDTPVFIFSMTFFYSLYYVLPVSVLAWFMLKGDIDQFRLARRGLVIALYGGYCFYVLVPVAGPVDGQDLLQPLPFESIPSYQYMMENFRYSFDCFPSLHTAIPWLLVMMCKDKVPVLVLWLLVAISVGITVSTMALRFHYGIDVIAGGIWAAVSYVLARLSVNHLNRPYPAARFLGATPHQPP